MCFVSIMKSIFSYEIWKDKNYKYNNACFYTKLHDKKKKQ